MHMVIDYQLIGRRIAARRKNNHITQESLAEYLDVSPAFISKIERGRTQLSLERLVQICHYLDTTPTELLYGSSLESASYMVPEMASLLEQCPKDALPLVRSLIEDVIHYSKNAKKNAD